MATKTHPDGLILPFLWLPILVWSCEGLPRSFRDDWESLGVFRSL